MKHLKIYFAVLFFSFLGGVNVELMAQNTLKVGDRLNWEKSQLYSTNKAYKLVYVKNALELRKSSEEVIWRCELPYKAGNEDTINKYIRVSEGTLMTTYGNVNDNQENKEVVLFGGENRGGKGTFLRIQDDGNLVLYNGSWSGWSDGDALWATGTCGGVLGGCGVVGDR